MTEPPRAGQAEVLAVAGLTKRFGDRVAVDDVGFSIRAGETYGLLGPNGAGKTTIIRLVCGLLRADAGSITIAGAADGGAVVSRERIGYVPQDVALYPDLTARENLRFFARLYRLRGKALDRRIDEVLELIGLTDRAGDRVESFSGGMRRRLNIGAGLMHRPTLLILDEPTVGVDPQSRHAIMENVRALGASGMAVLYTTHYMEEAERLCDRVGIIDRGRLIAEGTRRELIDRLGEHDRITLSTDGDPARLVDRIGSVTGIEKVDSAGDEVHLIVREGRRMLPAVLDAAERSEVGVRSVEVTEPDLEAVFLHLTGAALRD
ncbi:ABC transporter ATP-binding protein [Amycolatopsis sp. CB00013]|uniref:ABC transporter ATP-binding protein n=1 Tax=Amycolatopsis sp. CB00013 TaxID=1703945 RepID=UPI0009391628|nr:ABC transporter ATP-binding protein [Amycolatopsis sp. CB00013]OKK01328.1 antibiotic ABC transporter ATP-binding protein [Amycolatopsis sp. CB00013]